MGINGIPDHMQAIQIVEVFLILFSSLVYTELQTPLFPPNLENLQRAKKAPS